MMFASLTFDDGSQNYFTHFRPMLRKYNLKASFYIITDQIGLANRMDWKQIETLHREGHEIGSHTHTHQRLNQLSNKELDFELRESKRRLARFKPATLSYPFGDYNQRVINSARKYYSAARACGDLKGYENDLGFNFRGLNHFALKTVKLMLPKDFNDPFKNDSWLIFVVHDPPKMSLDYLFWSLKKRKPSWQEGLYFFQNILCHQKRQEKTTDKLAKICRFIKKHSIKVVTIEEGIRIFNK